MSRKLKEQQSREANYFARCLLMPKVLMIEEFTKYKNLHSSDLVLKMSEVFQVENEAMRFRLQELNLMDYGLQSVT